LQAAKIVARLKLMMDMSMDRQRQQQPQVLRFLSSQVRKHLRSG
jgi:hypothetical protein